jgi:hypothetical protein
VETIQRELGSLSSIILDRLGDVMDRGINDATGKALDEAEKVEGRKETAEAELESERKELKKLQREIEDAGEILNRSRKIMDFDPKMLREIVEVGLELSGVGRLKGVNSENGDQPNPEYALPEMPDSWQPTLDALRPPRGRTEPEWEWRRKSPQPVVFKALDRMDSSRVHLHLQHPFVQRILSRFLAQGGSSAGPEPGHHRPQSGRRPRAGRRLRAALALRPGRRAASRSARVRCRPVARI